MLFFAVNGILKQRKNVIRIADESEIGWKVVACDLKQCGILSCVDSDEPVQPPFKFRH